jgi:hypothetical protein
MRFFERMLFLDQTTQGAKNAFIDEFLVTQSQLALILGEMLGHIYIYFTIPKISSAKSKLVNFLPTLH